MATSPALPQNKYYANPRREMLPFIPPEVKRVLEVGCGVGEFASLLKKERNIEVWGIEINKEAADRAMTKLDKVLVGNIEQNEFDLPEEYFNCVVFNDVLEHLIDPWSVLKKMRNILKSDGYVIASIPNVRYFDNIKKLLKYKEWQYEDEGILDRTHLRFFTIKSIPDLFKNSGYDVVTISGIKGRQFPWKFRFINYLMKKTFEDMKYERFACIAKKRAAK